MVAQAAAGVPRRVSLTNLETGEGWFAMFNPTQFTETVSVNWNRQSVLGLSHQPLQYGFTGNHIFSLDLFNRAGGPTSNLLNPFTEDAVRDKTPTRNLQDIAAVKKFLLALAYPIQATNVGGGGPPRVLVVWPNHLSLVCIVTGIQFASTRFNKQGHAVEYVATVGFEEIRDKRINSSQIRNLGTFRGTE